MVNVNTELRRVNPLSFAVFRSSLLFFSFFWSFWSFEIYEFYIKLQGCICRNGSHRSLAIGYVRWAVEDCFSTLVELKESIVPTLDNHALSNDKIKRFASVSAWVKLGSVKQCSGVMSFYLCTGCHSWSLAFLVNFHTKLGRVNSLSLAIFRFCLLFFCLLCRLFSFNLNKFNIKSQCCTCRDRSNCFLAVSIIRWAVQGCFSSFVELKECLIPAFDHLTWTNSKLQGLLTLTWVKYCTVS